MSKFLTPPSWYDKNGEEINIFNNTTYHGTVENTAIGTSAIAGGSSAVGGAVAVGSQAQAKEPLSIAIGSYNDDNFQTVQALATGSIAIGAGAKANADSTDGIAIGSRATSGQGGIAIGAGASATANQIQLGNPNVVYDLKIGNNIGTINGINLFQAFASDGRTVQSANSAKMVKSVKEDANSSMSAMTITKLLTGAIYVVAVRFLNTNISASIGDIHSSFILVDTANSPGTICFGSGCPILGASASVCARYVSQTPDSSGAKGNIDIVQISDSAFSTYPEATIKSICAFRIN